VEVNNTSSRILREEEHAAVKAVWWQDIAVPAANHTRNEVTSRPESNGPDPALDRERERLEKEAYQRGFSEGKGVGREQAGAELKSVLDRMTQTLAELSTLRSRIRKEAEGDLVKLSISVARRVLHRELTLDPESIEGLIRIALEKLESRDVCRIRLHPDQEPAIRASMERFSNSQQVELISDPSLQCGDVLFETAHGNIDASVEAQLREIERGFADRLGK
jgi:flagellar assembly protein FliH